MSQRFQIAGALIASALLALGGRVAAQDPGDVNSDGRISQTDVHLTVRHLLGSEELTGGELDRADLNASPGLDIGDAVSITNLIPSVDEVWFELDGSASPRRMGEGIAECDDYPIALALDPEGNPSVFFLKWAVDSDLEIWQWDGAEWHPMPGGQFSFIDYVDHLYFEPLFGINDFGHVYAGWFEQTYPLTLRMRLWNGTNWISIDDGNARAVPKRLAMAIDPTTGHPVVVWDGPAFETEGNQSVQWAEMIVRRWTGSDWETIHDEPFAPNPSWDSQPDIIVDSAGRPTVVWIEETESQGDRIHLRRWNGVTWEEIGSGSASGGGLSPEAVSVKEPTLAQDQDDHPLVAWVSEQSGGDGHFSLLHVRRWTGLTWETLAGLPASGESISNIFIEAPALTVDGSGNPIVTFTEESEDGSGSDIRILRWNGVHWEEVSGTPLVTPVSSSPLEVPHDSEIETDPEGRLIVAHVWGRDFTKYRADRVCAWANRLENGVWQGLGEVCQITGGLTCSYPEHGSLSTSMVLTAEGDPMICWVERTEVSSEINVVEWDGAQWLKFDSSPGFGDSHAFTIDSMGRPVIAFSSGAFEPEEIFVRRWSGTQWDEVGAGSATGEGISGTPAASINPSIVIDSADRPVVAWSERLSLSEYRMFIRRWNGSQWAELSPGSASGEGIPGTSEHAGFPRIVIDGDDNITVAWGNDKSVYVTRWNGTAWEDVGASSASGEGIWTDHWPYSVGISVSSIALDSHGYPVIVGNDFIPAPPMGIFPANLFCLRWDGAQWTEIPIPQQGDPTQSEGGATPLVQIDPSDQIVLAYLSGDNVMVQRWTGEIWEEVGMGSARGDGVSQTERESYSLSLALDSEGNPAVAWSQHGWEIFFLTAGPGL